MRDIVVVIFFCFASGELRFTVRGADEVGLVGVVGTDTVSGSNGCTNELGGGRWWWESTVVVVVVVLVVMEGEKNEISVTLARPARSRSRAFFLL